ncbi:MAG: hypothetical protein WAW37_02270 [Syntrophobacteraceae bacterium]
MKCVEIITLRSLAKDNRKLVDELLRQVSEQKGLGSPASIEIYHHPIIETDLSIHIHWEIQGQNPYKSPLGQQLSYALKGLGLLNHSLWVEAAAWDDHQ